MAELPRDIGALLRDPVEEETARRVWRGVGVGRARVWNGEARLRKTAFAGVGALALAAAAAVVLLAAPSHRPAGLRLANGSELARTATDERLSLRLEGDISLDLDPGTILEPGRSEPDVREIRLLDGRVRADVRPGQSRRFRIDAGLVDVEVVGTRFSVERTPSSVRVSVSRGHVRVHDRGADTWTDLRAGGELTVYSAPSAPAHAPEPDSTEPREPIAPPPEPVDDVDRPRPSVPAWRELADDGQFSEAWDALGADRLQRRITHAQPEELMLLADVARRSREPQLAIAPLERILDRYPGDSRAPLAAYTLGVLHMDRLGQPDAAVTAFERARELGIGGTLAEHALGRLAVCRGRTGDHAGARNAATEYLRSHPDGARARQMEHLARQR